MRKEIADLNREARAKSVEVLILLFFFTLFTDPRRIWSPKLSDTRVYEPPIRARLGTTAHFCEVVLLKLRVRKEIASLNREALAKSVEVPCPLTTCPPDPLTP